MDSLLRQISYSAWLSTMNEQFRVLERAVRGEDRVVRLDDGSRERRRRVDGELGLELLAVVRGEALEEEHGEARAVAPPNDWKTKNLCRPTQGSLRRRVLSRTVSMISSPIV